MDYNYFRWLKNWLSRPSEPEPVSPSPVALPPITIVGTTFCRGLQAYRIIGKSFDWAVQPGDWDAYRRIVDGDAALGVNLYYAFAAPGLGKPLYTGNEGGAPYRNITTLIRNENYWRAVDQRMLYAESAGISLVVANTFCDQGILTRYSLPLLTSDWLATVGRFAGHSVLYLPLSEYDEGGATGVQAALHLARQTILADPRCVVTLHATSSSAPQYPAQHFISHQGWDPRGLERDLQYGKPVICAEDQSARHDGSLMIDRFNAAERIGATYIFTGQNFSWRPEIAAWLRHGA